MNIIFTNKVILIALLSIFFILLIYMLYINLRNCLYVKKYTNLLSFIDNLDEESPKEIIINNFKKSNRNEIENLEDIIEKTNDDIILKNNII